MASLIGVLRAAYPAICRLVGEDHFNHAAAAYVRRHPPRRPHLSTYGWRFAKFLTGFEPAQGLRYLPDLARLEWARNLAYFAADLAPLDPRTLAVASPDNLGLSLHPSVRLVASPYPIQQIWNAARDEIGTFDPDAGAEHVLVTRPDMHVEAHALTRGDFTLLLALDAGATLGQAANAAIAIEPEFNLQQGLLGHFERGTFRAARTTNLEEAIR